MKNLKMTPNKELLEFAKEKAKMLKTHKQSIRLKGGEYESSYYLFNFSEKIYIGTYKKASLKNFFKNKPTYELIDNSTKEVTATMQLLLKK